MDQFKYGYDRASNRTWREVAPNGGNPTGFDEYYTYDGLHRLERSQRGTLSGTPYDSITSPVKTQDFGLEALGNWKTFKEDDDANLDWDVLDQSRLHNKVNEIDNDDNHANAPSGSISGGSWVLPVYDAAGNMTAGPRPGKENHRPWYIWDAWNRLAAVWMDDGDGTMEITGENPQDILIATYRYDGLHRRIRKLLGTNPAAPNPAYDYYYNESWQIVEVRKGADTDPYEQFVWDVRYIDAPVVRFRDGNTDGDLTGGTQEGDNTLYYTNDANMNVTALVDGYDGAAVERYMYDPYGKPTVLNGVRDSTGTATTEWNARTSNTFQNAILYCGYFFDDESGFYSVRWRYYHPTLGRWVTRDVLFDSELQEYCRSAPVDLRDATGLRPDIVIPAEVSVYAGLGFSIHAEYRGHAEDCCDSDGRLIKDGKQSDSVSASVSVGFGVGVEGKIGPISIGIVLKGPQVEVSGEARTPDAPCEEIPEGVTVVSTAELFMGVGMEAGVIVVGGSAESCHGENPAYYNISLILTANPDGGHVELKVSRGQRTKCACNVGPCEWTETKDDSPPSRTLWEYTFSAPR